MLSLDAAREYVRCLTGDMAVDLADAPRPACDADNHRIMMPFNLFGVESLLPLAGALIRHEAGHLMFPDPSYAGADGLLRRLANLFDDLYIERRMSRRWPGMADGFRLLGRALWRTASVPALERPLAYVFWQLQRDYRGVQGVPAGDGYPWWREYSAVKHVVDTWFENCDRGRVCGAVTPAAVVYGILAPFVKNVSADWQLDALGFDVSSGRALMSYDVESAVSDGNAARGGGRAGTSGRRVRPVSLVPARKCAGYGHGVVTDAETELFVSRCRRRVRDAVAGSRRRRRHVAVSGVLDARRVARAAVPGYRWLYRRDMEEVPDISVCVVLDMSKSMRWSDDGRRMAAASRAVAEALSRMPGVSVEWVGHVADRNLVTGRVADGIAQEVVFHGYDDRAPVDGADVCRFAGEVPAGNNADASVIRDVAARLRRRRGRRFVIAFTDGCPECSFDKDWRMSALEAASAGVPLCAVVSPCSKNKEAARRVARHVWGRVSDICGMADLVAGAVATA